MKGIILAGGSGSRLDPLTKIISKQLLPIYDKPLIYYPLSTLMESGIKDILIICTAESISNFYKLLNDGSHLGISISYQIQKKPEGIAQSFLLARNFLNPNDKCCLILGDNIFYGSQVSQSIIDNKNVSGAVIYGYKVHDPERYGVIELDSKNNLINIQEKPKNPKSNYAVTGLYLYDSTVLNYVKDLKPSKRNELEITDLNNLYLKDKKLNIEILQNGVAWLDTGTHESLLEASTFIGTIQKRQGIIVSCPEEIALRKNFISINSFEEFIKFSKETPYISYLKEIYKNYKKTI